MSPGEHTEANARAGHRLADAAHETTLIGQVAGGDLTAFETLFRPRLRRLIEQKTRLRRALMSLSHEHRTVIELTYYEGCSYREIAASSAALLIR